MKNSDFLYLKSTRSIFLAYDMARARLWWSDEDLDFTLLGKIQT